MLQAQESPLAKCIPSVLKELAGPVGLGPKRLPSSKTNAEPGFHLLGHRIVVVTSSLSGGSTLSGCVACTSPPLRLQGCRLPRF